MLFVPGTLLIDCTFYSYMKIQLHHQSIITNRCPKATVENKAICYDISYQTIANRDRSRSGGQAAGWADQGTDECSDGGTDGPRATGYG